MAMTLRLSEQQDKALTEIASSLGISKNSAAKDKYSIEEIANWVSNRKTTMPDASGI
jgi:DNA-binding CsgD family transcriptional regulator